MLLKVFLVKSMLKISIRFHSKEGLCNKDHIAFSSSNN